MGKLTGADLNGEPQDFASTLWRFRLRRASPAAIAGFEDLVKPLCHLWCAPPRFRAFGRGEGRLSGRGHVEAGERGTVRECCPAKVTSGEVNAGLVYVIDVKVASDTVRGIAFPETGAAVKV